MGNAHSQQWLWDRTLKKIVRNPRWKPPKAYFNMQIQLKDIDSELDRLQKEKTELINKMARL